MYLTRIKLTNFKNCTVSELLFDNKVNIIYGHNGSGKTNFLDAVHFLSVAKSYFGLSDKSLVRDGADFYRLEGQFEDSGKKEHLLIKYKREQKRSIELNGKKLKAIQDLIGRFPLVLVAPDDIDIVRGGSKERRSYFNKWLCQSDREYLKNLILYNRLLRQKDALLKGDRRPERLSIEAFNHQMIPLAEHLHKATRSALDTFIPLTIKHNQEITNSNSPITINHLSDLTGRDIKGLFEESIDQEIMVRRPLVGVQRDDYEFLIENKPFKKFGSQGQIKSLLYSLRLAEFDYLRQHLNITPIMALDDFFEKLDTLRLSSLLSLINMGEFSQVFLTDTELERSKKIFRERGIKFGAYYVEHGKIERVV